MGLNNKKESDDWQMTGIDRVIHEHARFRIMAQLYVIESADFLFLMRQTGLTHGNLSAHLRRLEDTGYIEIEKEFVGKKPHTMLHLTSKGRKAFDDYREKMKQMLDHLPVGEK
jgi:DNA-binding MarR family transcriptional regulator